jgi:hypothetical protein
VSNNLDSDTVAGHVTGRSNQEERVVHPNVTVHTQSPTESSINRSKKPRPGQAPGASDGTGATEEPSHTVTALARTEKEMRRIERRDSIRVIGGAGEGGMGDRKGG